ncbi:hypothetical protein [Planococcus lenghuensis]|uniref:Transposase n=1 Tax=Planococcus lenghuensis TaxID=2213202 RepID=A0A1Q2L0I6_9BACL|nr:hypothetical protein [Planococcus lenghuensis]AQQ53970.1 hypothetical protein B0X71_13275 [Planococcus lenghuensis]
MKYGQYRKVVEREYEQSLGELMYKLCKEEKVSALEGAKRLGVPKEIFIYWRHHYRLEPKQIAFDEAVDELTGRKEKFSQDLQEENLDRPLQYGDEVSLRGFAEMIDRRIACCKSVHYQSEGLDPEAGLLPFYEFTAELVDEYRKKATDDPENK